MDKEIKLTQRPSKYNEIVRETTIDKTRLSWTQPICEVDWIAQNSKWEPAPEIGPDAERLIEIRMPVRVVDSEIKTCAFCGNPTIFGVFIRADPKKVSYPAKDDLI